MATIDLRSTLLSVRQQGRRQSCLAFASTAAHERQAGVDRELCVEYLFFHTVSRTAGADPDAGTTMAAAAAALAEEGQPLESAWPYLPTQLYAPAWIPPAINSPLHKANMAVGALSFDEIVQRLAGGRPIVLGLVITDAFYRPNALGIIKERNSDPERGGHAVLAVGHGVDASGERHLMIRNSWGSTWGFGGHGWLPKAYVDRQLHETAILT